VVKLAPIQPVPSITVGTSAGPTTALPRSLIEHSSILRAATEDLGDDGLADLVLPAHIVTESALLDLDRMIRDDGGHTSRWRDAAWFPHDPAALEAAMLAADFLDLPAEIMNLLIGRYVQRVFTIEECNARGSSS
jgi:hypothetical protein